MLEGWFSSCPGLGWAAPILLLVSKRSLHKFLLCWVERGVIITRAPLHACLLAAKAILPVRFQKGVWLASLPRNSSSPLLAVQTALRKPVLPILSLGSNCWLPLPHLWWKKQIQLSSFSLHYGHITSVFVGQAPTQIKTETSPWPSTYLKILQAEWSLLARQINPVNGMGSCPRNILGPFLCIIPLQKLPVTSYNSKYMEQHCTKYSNSSDALPLQI